MNMYLDGLKELQKCATSFQTLPSHYVLQYADDTCLVSDGPATCRAMLDFTDRWILWSQMRAKVSKYQALAIEASTGSLQPKFTCGWWKDPLNG